MPDSMENTPISPWDAKAPMNAAGEQDRYSWRYAAATFVFLLWWYVPSAIDENYSLWPTIRFLHNVSLFGIVLYLLAAVVRSSVKAHFARLTSIIFGSLFTLLAFTLVADGLSDAPPYVFIQQGVESPEQIADERAVAEDYKFHHDGQYTWKVDDRKAFPSPDGLRVATVEYGHVEPYFVGPPFFSRVLVGKQDESRSRDILVYGVWYPRSTPDVEWLPDGKLQLTSRNVDDFYRCRHRAAGIDVLHVMGKDMKPESFRAALDEKVRMMEQRRSIVPQDEERQRAFEGSATIFKQSIEKDWKRYLKCMEEVRDNAGTERQCVVQP